MDNEKLIQAKKALDDARSKYEEVKASGEPSAEDLAFVDRALDDVERLENEAKAEERDARIKALESAFTQQHEAAEEARNEIAKGVTMPEIKVADAPKGTSSPEYVKAFERYIRGDRSANGFLMAESKAAGAEGADGTGGYLVPTQLWSELWVDASAGYPLIDYVTSYESGEGYKLNIDQAFSHGTFTEVTEAGTPAASDETYTQVTITAYKGQRMSKMSDEVIADARFDVAAHLTRMLARQAAEWQNARLTTGNGTTQAKGIVTFLAADATNDLTVSSSSTITFDDLNTLLHSVGSQYRSNARWMINDDTARILRTVKDADGRYIWETSIQAGVPSALLGFPVLLNPDMATVASAAKTVVFGDLSNHVRFVPNGGQIEVKRLEELYAGTGQVGFRATQRFGADWGGVPDAGAVLIQAT